MKSFFEILILLLLILPLNAQNIKNSSGEKKSSEKSIKATFNIKAKDEIAPTIAIISPNLKKGFKPSTEEKLFTITGKAEDENGIYEVIVNEIEAKVTPDGVFQASVPLAYGDNTITIKATDTKNNASYEKFHIERKGEEPVIQNNIITGQPLTGKGKYYALIIGNNDYADQEISSLNEPVNDATKLYNLLITSYTFEPQNLTFLKNASYIQIIEAFDNLNNKITMDDNLLVFYAGKYKMQVTKAAN